MSKLLRWGIVGCGDIANKAVAPAIIAHPACRLAAVCSGSRARAEEFAASHQAEQAFDDFDRFLACGLDCVYVASRVFQHEEQTRRALEAGRHVLCEKPMAMNATECERMLDAEAKAGRKLGVAYYRRLYPAWRRAVEAARAGEIGGLVAARFLLTSFWGLSPENPKYWRVKKSLSGGGPFADIGTHRLDLLVELAGAPLSVAAFLDCREHAWDVEDTGAAAMRLPGQAHATAVVSGCAGARHDDFDIVGTEGAIFLPGLKETVIFEASGRKATENHPLPPNSHYPLLDDFVQAVLTGARPVCPGEEGAKTTRVLDAIYRSAARGTVETV